MSQVGRVKMALSAHGEVFATLHPELKQIKIWNVQTGEIITVLQEDRVSDLAFSPDGTTLVLGLYNRGDVYIYDTNAWKRQAVLTDKVMGFGTVRALCFSADGNTLYTGHEDGIIAIWDMTGTRLVNTLRADGYSVSSLAISQDGRTLIHADPVVGNVRVWNLVCGEQVTCWNVPNSWGLVSLSPNDESLFTGGLEVREWKAGSRF